MVRAPEAEKFPGMPAGWTQGTTYPAITLQVTDAE